MIASQPIRLYDARDVPWIATVVDEIVASVGEPWRVLRERLELSGVRAPRVATVLGALRRVVGGRAARARIARKVRALVLGHPALDAVARTERLHRAAETLGVELAEVRSLLWIDLANERPVALPEGRPAELRLAAYANLDRIQRAVRRARELRLRVWDDAHDLIRTAARYGLLATVRRDRDATVIEVVGPLSLFHATAIYGRALAALIPLLADHARFELELTCDFGHGPTTLSVAPPILLPPVAAAHGPSLAARLARGLAKACPRAIVTLDPPPIVRGADLLYPDVQIEHREAAWFVEIVGFATADYLAAKLARYQAAEIENVILCVDESRVGPGVVGASDTHHVLPFHGKLAPQAVLEIIEATR